MSSYRKKHNTSKPVKPKPEPALQPDPEYSNPGVVRSIHTNRLTSGLPYQRPVNPKEVERLIREWDERLLDPVTVSFRDGRFYVVDGQHRISAMRKMNGGRGVMVDCKVYDGLTYEQEADLCYKLDKAKKRLSLSQSTNAGRRILYPHVTAFVGRLGGRPALPDSGCTFRHGALC